MNNTQASSSSQSLMASPQPPTYKSVPKDRTYSLPSHDGTGSIGENDIQEKNALERRLRRKVDIRLCTIAGLGFWRESGVEACRKPQR